VRREVLPQGGLVGRPGSSGLGSRPRRCRAGDAPRAGALQISRSSPPSFRRGCIQAVYREARFSHGRLIRIERVARDNPGNLPAV
jgi:hypothetical protein